MQTIDEALLKILVCPETKQKVQLAPVPLLNKLNELQSRGELHNRSGAAYLEKIEAGLLREDGKVLYPIKEGIPVMLINESIVVN